MEFEDVSEQMEWEARRVAAAFGIEDWRRNEADDKPAHISFEGNNSLGLSFAWSISRSGIFNTLWLDGDFLLYRSSSDGELYCEDFSPDYNRIAAQGLYRMGIESTGTLADLASLLTSHEKLELRLSLPREFWPQKWLDEEAE